jgi:hypothetical protein
MQEFSRHPFTYRGISICIQVERADDGVFGHADLFARDVFKARISVGSARRHTEKIYARLRCLAKAKVDTWAVTGTKALH